MQMKTKLAIHGGEPVIDASEARFNWPIITDETERAAVRQLHESLSIYDDSGIFGSFEKKFATYHGRQYGLLSNSGTSSILAMFEAIDLRLGDEIITPVYTFHATASPMMSLGFVPIFADCDNEGNITLESIKEKRSPKTKAVIVTHMWGVPVRDIEAIAAYCKVEGLYLLEDCSHAHGASINGKPVGSFGDMAAWSLQGQKIITGGEGGILLTDDVQLFNRALLHGHYNKRPQRNIDKNDPMYEYFLTGFGLKLRAHPIAIAIADQQFDQLESFNTYKNIYAKRLIEALDAFDFIRVEHLLESTNASWYALGFHFVPEKAHGVSREQFVEALHAEGLVEFDIPGSTGLLNQLPLFVAPHKALPRLYDAPLVEQGPFPSAAKFYASFIKLPVWAYEGDEAVVQAYIDGFTKVAQYLTEHQTLAD
jgi:dTDP-4-amino-4,6-dideoxygalactose transaminase